MAELHHASFVGEAIAQQLEALGQLRIAVFRDFPYLYAGSMAYELEYLATYVRSPRSFLHCVYDCGEMVGATTCIPLGDETAEVQAPFLAAGMDPRDIFYFGESILLGAYRGLGLGHRFFDEREAHARSYGSYAHACFCAVQRPENHPLRPSDYRPLDDFWTKRGYERRPSLQSSFEWQDIDKSASDAKPMVYWMKAL